MPSQNLGDTKDLSLEIASALGTEYFKRVSHLKHGSIENSIVDPLETGQTFSQSCRFDQRVSISKAKDVYQNNMDGFSTKVQGKALYNMAILHEALGEYDRMVKAQRADGILQSRKSARYLEYTKIDEMMSVNSSNK